MNKNIIKRIFFFVLSASCAFVFAFDARAAGNVIRSGASSGDKRVALTFDDGPHPRKTDEILDVLCEYGVKATFFVIGKNAENYPDAVIREAAEGHEIGNHTYSHKRLTECADVGFEISKTSDIIFSLTGRRPTLMRPPEGAYRKENVAVVQNCGCDMVLWTVDTRDWAKASVNDIVANVKKNVRDGSIILFHDYTSEGAHTTEALKLIVPYLIGEGYEIVTVSKLMTKR